MNKTPKNKKKPTPKMLLVLNAAQSSFLQKGFEGTNMDDIARDAGVARRSIYYNFASKEELFKAVVENVWNQLASFGTISPQRSSENPVKALTAIGLSIAHFWAPPLTQSFLRLIIREGERFPQLAQDFYRQSKALAIEQIDDYFSQLEASGVMHFTDKDIATRQFVGLITEPLLWLRLIGVGGEPDSARCQLVVDEAVKTFCARYMRGLN